MNPLQMSGRMTISTGKSPIYNLGSRVLTVGFRYLWNDYDGTFTNIDMDALNAFAQEPPPDNCPVCEMSKKFDEDLGPTKIHLGVRWHCVNYHLDDCVLIKAEEGPCHIGHIIEFVHGRGHDNVKVEVRLFGRTDRLGCRPDTTLKDEVGLLAWKSISLHIFSRPETSISHRRQDDDRCR